jgi:hypothetical protein
MGVGESVGKGKKKAKGKRQKEKGKRGGSGLRFFTLITITGTSLRMTRVVVGA